MRSITLFLYRVGIPILMFSFSSQLHAEGEPLKSEQPGEADSIEGAEVDDEGGAESSEERGAGLSVIAYYQSLPKEQ